MSGAIKSISIKKEPLKNGSFHKSRSNLWEHIFDLKTVTTKGLNLKNPLEQRKP